LTGDLAKKQEKTVGQEKTGAAATLLLAK